jgi:hypothetical protein
MMRTTRIVAAIRFGDSTSRPSAEPGSGRAARKPPLALLAVALLGSGACGCGGGSARPASQVSANATVSNPAAATVAVATAPAPAHPRADGDKDNDVGAPDDDRSNSRSLSFGHVASASEQRTIAMLVKRYYATALAGDGPKACSMLYSTFAESVPEDYGLVPGPLYMRGARTCAAALALLFKHFHALLAVEVPRLAVTRVRLVAHHGFALLGFGSLPERQIAVAREGHTWRIAALLDSELP